MDDAECPEDVGGGLQGATADDDPAVSFAAVDHLDEVHDSGETEEHTEEIVCC